MGEGKGCTDIRSAPKQSHGRERPLKGPFKARNTIQGKKVLGAKREDYVTGDRRISGQSGTPLGLAKHKESKTKGEEGEN